MIETLRLLTTVFSNSGNHYIYIKSQVTCIEYFIICIRTITLTFEQCTGHLDQYEDRNVSFYTFVEQPAFKELGKLFRHCVY